MPQETTARIQRKDAHSPAHDLALALRSAYLAMHRETDASLSALEVTADQFVVLSALAAGEAGTQRELVARTGSDPSTLRAMLVLLEKRALVERRPHPTDGRARRVRLTPGGHEVLERSWEATAPVRQRLVDALAPGQAEEMARGLATLARTLRPATHRDSRTLGRGEPADGNL